MAVEQGEKFSTGKALLAGAAGGGIIALIDWLRSKAEAAPPEGAVIFTPDEWTKETLLAMLTVLTQISTKLDKLENIETLLGGEPALAELEITPIESTTIPGLSPKNLYLSESPHRGSVVGIVLVSDSRYVQYDLHLDDVVWSFNVSDMIDNSIEYPHFPGGWIAEATGARFVFVFSSGGAMQVKYRTNFRLQAKATTGADVNIVQGELVRRTYVVG